MTTPRQAADAPMCARLPATGSRSGGGNGAPLANDRFFFDPHADNYTVQKYLGDLNARYGGVDSILMWGFGVLHSHAWPCWTGARG
jgi:hypothetical protein